MSKKYVVTATSGNANEVNVSNGLFSDNEKNEIEIVKHKGDNFTVKIGNETLKADLLYAEYTAKTFTISVNNHRYKLQAADEFDLLLKQLGIDTSGSAQIKELKAPMPGMVLNIFVSPGDKVNKGDNLVLLEAMKMENSIKSPGAGTIKQVLAVKGKAVEKNQILIEFE